MRKLIYTLSTIILLSTLFLATGTIDQVSAQVTDWQTSGDKIYYDAGNVGIGTDNPGGMMTIMQDATTKGLILNQQNLNNVNMMRMSFTGGTGGSSANASSLLYATSTSRYRNFMSYEGPEDIFNITAKGAIKLGYPDNPAVIDGSADVEGLNPGSTASAAIFTGRPNGHLIMDVDGNDGLDAFAIRGSSDGGGMDRIMFYARANGQICIGKCY